MYRVLRSAQAAEGESVVRGLIENELEVLLVHPGGPFWTRKDKGVWSIPKGEIDEGETPLHAARREFPGGNRLPGRR